MGTLDRVSVMGTVWGLWGSRSVGMSSHLRWGGVMKPRVLLFWPGVAALVLPVLRTVVGACGCGPVMCMAWVRGCGCG